MYNSAFTPPPFLYRKGGITGFEGSKDLKPMKIESGEFVVFGTLNKFFTYSSQFYINKIDNYITREGQTAYYNESTERIHSGFEAELRFRNQKVTERLMLAGFLNFSTVSIYNFSDSVQHRYSDVFNRALYDDTDALTLFPKMTTNLAVYGIYKFSKASIIRKISFGVNLEYIGNSTVYSDYKNNPANNGEWIEESDEEIALNEKQTINAATILSVRLKAYTKKISVGLSTQNIGNVAYDLPTPVYRTKRKRGEGRMIYLTLEFNLSKTKKDESI